MCRSILFIAIFMFNLLDCFSQLHDLNFDLDKGKIYKLKQDVVQSTSQNMMGKVQKVETVISTTMAFEVKEKANDFLLVDVSITDMLFKMKSPMFKMEYDSRKMLKEGDMLGKLYSKVIGKNYSIIVDKKGQVKQVDGLNALIYSIIEDCDISDPLVKAQMESSVKQMFGESVIRGNMEMLTNIFPKQEVKIGDKWSNLVSLVNLMPVDYNNVWELKAVNAANVVIAGNTTIQSKVNGEWKMVNGVPTMYDIKGNQTSKINIDKKSGWIISSDIESIMRGKIIMDKCEKIPEKMVVPIEIKTITKYKSIN